MHPWTAEHPTGHDIRLEALLCAIEDDIALVGNGCEHQVFLDTPWLPRTVLDLVAFLNEPLLNITLYKPDHAYGWTRMGRELVGFRRNARVEWFVCTDRGLFLLERYR